MIGPNASLPPTVTVTTCTSLRRFLSALRRSSRAVAAGSCSSMRSCVVSPGQAGWFDRCRDRRSGQVHQLELPAPGGRVLPLARQAVQGRLQVLAELGHVPTGLPSIDRRPVVAGHDIGRLLAVGDRVPERQVHRQPRHQVRRVPRHRSSHTATKHPGHHQGERRNEPHHYRHRTHPLNACAVGGHGIRAAWAPSACCTSHTPPTPEQRGRAQGPPGSLARREVPTRGRHRCSRQGIPVSGQVSPVAVSTSAALATVSVAGGASEIAVTATGSKAPGARVATETCGIHDAGR